MGKVFYTDISVPVGPVYHMVHKPVISGCELLLDCNNEICEEFL